MPEIITIPSIRDKWKSPLISELEIHLQVSKLANLINSTTDSKEIFILAVLKGSFVFASDLSRRLCKLGKQVELDFISASSYGLNTVSQGNVDIKLINSTDLKDKNVLIVDDIIDTGTTLAAIYSFIKKSGAAEVKACVLLDKISRRVVEFKPDYVGFEVPDAFFVGYGMDVAGKFRCLPYITSLEDAKAGLHSCE